jgi:hypothetical protein
MNNFNSETNEKVSVLTHCVELLKELFYITLLF